MTGAARFALVAAAVMVTGCAGGPRAEAPPPPPAQTVRAGGLALTAVADQWRAFPPDLDRYYLAIETTIENGREAPVELRYEDFALLDPSGGVRTAIAPRDATITLFGRYGRQHSEAAPGLRPVTTYFGFGARFGYPYYGWPYDYGPYYDPYWYWPPPGYYYYRPAPRWRTYEEATGDLVRYGLRAGPLAAGATVSGFLYFPRGEGEATNLRLRWSAPGLEAPLVAPVAGD
ncbi:MAG TPA: hypothetical protein VIM86_10965 [Thermodesulfobacteriota bacterium]